MDITALPYVDEHVTQVGAPPDAVWRALGDALDGAFSGTGAAAYARLVGCADRSASGPRPPARGSTFPGFRVAGAEPGRELVLIGRHHFSTYALVFRLDAAGPRIRVRAETRGRFPGPLGALYRLLVIGSGGHAVGVPRLLADVRRRAERDRSGRRP
jgi:hypothetical protein